MQIVNGQWTAIANRISTLDLLYFPFRIQLLRGLQMAHEADIPVRIFETFRSRPRQGNLYANGRTRGGRVVTNAKPGESMHNYGLAADLVMHIDGEWTWGHPDLYHKLGPVMEAAGLKWLGRSRRFPELVHYQYRDTPSIYIMQELYKKYGIEGVWLSLNQRTKNKGG